MRSPKSSANALPFLTDLPRQGQSRRSFLALLAGGVTLTLSHGGCASAQYVVASEVGATLEGRASYYSDRLAGRSTASGEPYRPEALTAASRDLPFHSLVRVTRLSPSGEAMGSVEVRINDRGPFRDHSRILDLSRAAAEELDMIRAGVVSVRVEVLRVGR